VDRRAYAERPINALCGENHTDADCNLVRATASIDASTQPCRINVRRRSVWGMGLRSFSFVALLASLVGACALTDPVDYRYDNIGRSLAVARNEAIFLNIVRASHDYPLAFTTISQVTPSMTNTTSFALPSFMEGPGGIHVANGATSAVSTFPTSSSFRDVLFGNTTASNATAVSSNFNVATQETSSFYLGFLKPIDLQTLDYFIRQGYSREMLFWLFADTVELKLGSHTIGMRYDPPRDYGCDKNDPKPLCWPDFVLIAIGAGLTVEELTVQTPASGAAKGAGAGGGGGGKDSSGSGSGSGSGGAGGKGETTIYARFCFDPVLARQAQRQMGDRWLPVAKAFDVSLAGPKCGTKWDPAKQAEQPQVDTLNFNVGPYVFRITPRSAFGTFQFLGNLMKLQRQQAEQQQDLPPYIPPGREDVAGSPLLATVRDDPNLLTVLQSGPGTCFVHTWFYDGDYCVPENATTTKHIFSLLAQLIAIQTAASDLSITPIVRVIQ
jgi:uncharacterized membrane protein YgcG